MEKTLHKRAGKLLGHNARSLWYTGQDASRAASLVARSKTATKKALQKAGLPTPRLYATIRNRQELARFRWTKLPASFVIKPRSAYGGGGVLVVFGRNKKGNWVKNNQAEVFIPQLGKHVLDILDGNFSSSNVPDIALIEQRVKNHPELKQYCHKGVADLRILIYNHVPIMAMLRLPTTESQSKSNLHAGGVGVGVDLARGITTEAIHRGHIIETLPNSRLTLAGIHIPYWKEVLLIAVKAADAIGLPFAGVDIALDRDDGPLILEVNSRPGLNIQLANMAPLLSRLKRVEDLDVSSPKKGVRIGISLFGGDVEQEIEDLAGQAVIGFTEAVTVYDQNGEPHLLTAKIDTGAWRTTLDEVLAKKYSLISNVVNRTKVRGALGREERPIIELRFSIKDNHVKTHAFVADRSHMKYNMIIGRRDLKGFLIDPSRKT